MERSEEERETEWEKKKECKRRLPVTMIHTIFACSTLFCLLIKFFCLRQQIIAAERKGEKTADEDYTDEDCISDSQQVRDTGW